MGRINMGRVILGGIVAGIVVNILGYLLDGLLLADQWNAGMKALGTKGSCQLAKLSGSISSVWPMESSWSGCTPRFVRGTALGPKPRCSLD